MPTDIDVSTGKCPVEGCCYVQAKGRSPDFKRHLATHTAALVPDKWICCGLPIQDARERGVHVSRDTVPREYEGIPMVGGCGQRFSRQDALKRHLDQGKGCIGKVDAPYLRGNQEKSAEKKSR
ncbi:hypothetical protein OBBRIDRAFT_798009 [Obba rivulosa]|uniref:C2H2-type domain-containing protein n=1 Tax=Obba rivulosa TaxID=1052685 RepID=A0A8E2DG62_9APHY|nr:hypothetical protein OBBRIDRAFT_798009 [Obba rivulosa]